MKANHISIENILTNSKRISLKNFNLSGNKLLINGKIISNSNFAKNGPVFLNNTKIVEKDEFINNITDTNQVDVVDLEGNYLTPALLDQHIHGSFGIDFNNSNESDIRTLLRKLKNFGHSGIIATFVPDIIDKLNSQMDLIRKIMTCHKNDETMILGINLEGPFFSKKKAGVHDPNLLLTPTVDNLQRFNLDSVKLMTIAPENDKNYKAIKYLNSLNIIASAGHSVASAEQVRYSGVKCLTHIFNAMAPFHHRTPTIVNEGLFNDDLYVEVNTALELLDPSTINLIQKLKPDDKIILISDALRGFKDGENSFILGTKNIYVDENNIAKDETGILAGSLLTLGQVAKTIVEKTNIDFEKFIKYTTINPARLLGLTGDFCIKENTNPDITIWDKNSLEPIKTFIKGV